jgi:hypothetical protein
MLGQEISRSEAREANRYLAERAREIGRNAPLGFLCECSDPDCLEPVPLDVTQYEVLRHVWAPVVGHRPPPAIRRG